jgi:hypothetical protein
MANSILKSLYPQPTALSLDSVLSLPKINRLRVQGFLIFLK